MIVCNGARSAIFVAAALAVMATLGLGAASSTAAYASPASPSSDSMNSDNQDSGNHVRGTGMLYSGDGVHYGTDVPDLFAGAPKLVPGESLERTFWLRNANTTAVEVSILPPAPTGRVLVDVHAGAKAVLALEPGASTSVQVAARLPDDAGNGSQFRREAVTLRVVVAEAHPGNPDKPGDPGWPGPPGDLGATGAALGMWPLAAAALVGGAAALASRRRTSRHEAGSTPTEGQQ
jgi:hypothetical protein